ncbi:MAG TPA: hypothetical protein PLZ11_05655 [Thauera sp.]|uniref:hypothetical protein n=1 Tax=Thauera sp. WB-2 TaxID=2897772 RepID=UPI0022DD9B3C|nr:hypothetical protein [Thauera sp. WB-2]WBL65842.1 hypothetical protein LQF09_08585 [Thauera sp. WB-2]HRJ23406.1 hypothetical protein [Thauera sp.]
MRFSLPHRCTLHIGVPKTGTTALQVFLAANAERLRSHGFNYSDAARRSSGHHDLAFLCSGGYPEWAVPNEKPFDVLAHQLKQDIQANPLELILSSENFYWLCSAEDVAQFIRGLGLHPQDTRIVIYLRQQEDMVASWYNQAVKALGYAGTLEQHMTENAELWDYHRSLAAWEMAFGRSNIQIRTYTANVDICRDFLAFLNLPEGDFKFSQERVNPSLNRDLLEFQRQVNQLPLPTVEKRQFHKALMQLSESVASTALFSTHPLLDAATRARVRAHYAAGNTQVAKRYLDRTELFEPSTPETEDGSLDTPPYPGLTVEKMWLIFGWLLSQSRKDTQ